MILLYYFAMNAWEEKKTILEKVNHETEARPFSIHRTYVGEENASALYLHCHPEAELFYLEEGTITFWVEDRSFTLHAGDGIFVPPNLTHHAEKRLGEACSHRAVVFSLEWLAGYLGETGNLYVNAILNHRPESVKVFCRGDEESRETLERLAGLRNYVSAPLQSYEMRLMGELMITLQEIFNAVSDQMRYNEKADGSREGVRKGIDYLMLHYGENVTLSALVESSGYSESHFCHRFKAVTGYAPFAYLNRIRIIKAAERLILTDDKITEIAGSCGFDNVSYFNRVFRRQMGTAPGEYRESGRRQREEKAWESLQKKNLPSEKQGSD